MLKERLITVILVLVIVALFGAIGLFGYKIIVEGYSVDQVIEYVKDIPNKLSGVAKDVENGIKNGTDSSEKEDKNDVVEQNQVVNNEVVQPAASGIDLSELKNYTGTDVDFATMKQLATIIINSYSEYITNGVMSDDMITIEFAKDVEQTQVENTKRLLNDYVVTRGSEEILGSFNITFSSNMAGNEVLTIDKNATLQF